MNSPQTNDRPGDPTEESMEREAAAWIARRDRGFTVAEAKAFASWKQSDPRHSVVFARVSSTWLGLDEMKADNDLAAMARSLRERAEGRSLQRHRRTKFSVALLAAAAAIVFAFVWQAGSNHAPATERYQVIASAARQLQLPDGSVAELNGDSQIETAFTDGERRVRLVSGEVHFVVAKDASRPFLVSAGPVVVRAVGTAFNVRLDDTAVDVLITEGKVRIEPRSEMANARPEQVENLVAGQRGTVDVSQPAPVIAVTTPRNEEVDEVLAWRSARLVFKDTPLDEVIHAFNQHNRRRFTLGDPTLSERRLTGVFRADNVNGFISLLGGTVDVTAEVRSSEEIVLWPAQH